MNEEESIKEKINETTNKLIDNNKEEDANCKDIIEKIYNNNNITKYTVDIVSYLIEYIKENIYHKYLNNVFKILEDNNMLTTILESKKNKYENINQDINQELVGEILKKYLDEITTEKRNNYKPKFLYGYNVPGFYNFYINVSNYVNKNIV